MLLGLILLWLISVPHVVAAPIASTPSNGEDTVLTPIHSFTEVARVETAPKPKAVKQRASVATRIAYCESHNDPKAKNPNSSAKGIYQFLDGTWEMYANAHWGANRRLHSVLNEEDNRELGEWVIETYGTSDWNASRDCWA